MEKKNQFSDHMFKLSNSELLKVLESRADYQPEAIIAAEIELKNRDLTNKDLTEARIENNQQKERVEKKNEKFDEFKGEVINSLDPLSRNTFRKRIVLLSGFFIVAFIFNLIDNIDLFKNLTTRIFDFTILEPISVLILLPLGGLFIWKEKKLGWIILAGLLTFYTTYYLFFQVAAIIIALTSDHELYTRTGEFKFTLKLIFMLALWISINKKGLREYLRINNTIRWLTIIISIMALTVIGLIII